MTPEDVKRLDALVAGVRSGDIPREAFAAAIAEAGYSGADIAFYSNLRGTPVSELFPLTLGVSTVAGAVREARTPQPTAPVNRTRQAVDKDRQVLENKGSFAFGDGPGGGTGASASDAFAAALLKAGWVPTNRPGVWFNPVTENTYDENKGSGSGEGGASGAAYAQVAENARQFDATRGDTKERNATLDAQFEKNYSTGVAQFEKNFERSAFESDRAYKQAREQFAQNFAENQYQYEASRSDSNAQFGARFDLDQRDMGARYATQVEQAGLEQARFERKQGLEEKKNTQEILRNPSDYIARAFESRGGASPDAKVTQADLINAMRADSTAASAQGTDYVNRLREIAGRFANVTPYTPPTAPRPAAAFAQPPAAPDPTPGYAVAPNGGIAFSAAEIQAGAQWAPTPVPKAEHGGTFGSNMVMTGDSSDGKENEELVIDLPNDGGLMVIPKDRLIGKRKRGGQAPAATDRKETDAMFADVPHMEAGGYASTFGSAPSGYKLADWAWDPMSVRNAGGSPFIQAGGASDPAARAAAAPAPATGSGYTAVTQDELVADAKRLAPPAITSVLAGGKPPAFRAAQPNLTPRKLAMMTASERTALNSYLGVVNNTTLADETQGVSSLFGPSVAGPRARQSMFGGR